MKSILTPITMTGESNHTNRPSVFGVNAEFGGAGYWPYQNHNQAPQANAPGNNQREFQSPGTAASSNYYFYSNYGPMPGAVSFPMYNPQNNRPPVNLRCKRKIEDPAPVKTKQHITEDRMAEHLSKLHISSENPAPSELETAVALEKRLYMCEEMRRFQTDCIIPESLLPRANPAPCKAIVLWTPPQRPFIPPPAPQRPRAPVPAPAVNGDDNNNNTDNNNEEAMPDNNLMMDLDA